VGVGVGGKLVKEMMAHGNGIMGYVVLIIRVMGQVRRTACPQILDLLLFILLHKHLYNVGVIIIHTSQPKKYTLGQLTYLNSFSSWIQELKVEI
jgi:hypothetical protein